MTSSIRDRLWRRSGRQSPRLVEGWTSALGIGTPGKKVFFISPQRSGTKSFGEMLEASGRRLCSWDQTLQTRLYEHWILRDYQGVEAILAEYDAFEDAPFFEFEFVHFVFFRFPEARFVLLRRPAEDWFDSMVAHSNGRTLGRTFGHALAYDRLVDLAQVVEHRPGADPMAPGLLDLADMKSHYIRWYNEHFARIDAFFRIQGAGHRVLSRDWSELSGSELQQFLELPFEPDIPVSHRTRGKADILARIYRR